MKYRNIINLYSEYFKFFYLPTNIFPNNEYTKEHARIGNANVELEKSIIKLEESLIENQKPKVIESKLELYEKYFYLPENLFNDTIYNKEHQAIEQKKENLKYINITNLQE